MSKRIPSGERDHYHVTALSAEEVERFIRANTKHVKKITPKGVAGANGITSPAIYAPLQNSREGGEASDPAQTSRLSPPRKIPRATKKANTRCRPPGETELAGHEWSESHRTNASQPHSDCGQSVLSNQYGAAAVGNQIIGRGQALSDAQSTTAPSDDPIPSQGHGYPAAQTAHALVGEITAVYRRYEDLRRARQRLLLQAMATCRTVCGGDKAAGAKLYKDPTPQVAVWLAPYEAAMAELSGPIAEHEKLLTKFGKQLPVAAWANTVPGLSHRFLAAIVGECGVGPGEFKSVAALWKRMGMAVIGGERQRRISGDAALEHGYVARRRALMWNIGDQVAVRQGIRNPKGDDGKPIGAVPANEWGALYLERKAYELARDCTPMHAHNRAKRYVEKRLLRELWKAWRRTTGCASAGADKPLLSSDEE